ncbi:MAG: energy transducer TonB [Acidobacteriota bacterium]
MRNSAQPFASGLISTCFHVAVVLLLLLAAAAVGPLPTLPPHLLILPLHTPLTAPRLQAPAKQEDSGGGQSSDQPPIRGKIPPPRPHRIFVPPMVALNDQPHLIVDTAMLDAPAVDVQLAGFGDPFGALDSGAGGPGRVGGFGGGDNGGLGPGSGRGFSIRETPPKVTRSPQVIYKEEPQYSEAARKSHMQGVVRLRIDVGLDGRPTNIRVVSGVGLGLDESAIEAVRKWRFRPALSGDRPVVAPALVDVGFYLL